MRSLARCVTDINNQLPHAGATNAAPPPVGITLYDPIGGIDSLSRGVEYLPTIAEYAELIEVDTPCESVDFWVGIPLSSHGYHFPRETNAFIAGGSDCGRGKKASISGLNVLKSRDEKEKVLAGLGLGVGVAAGDIGVGE